MGGLAERIASVTGLLILSQRALAAIGERIAQKAVMFNVDRSDKSFSAGCKKMSETHNSNTDCILFIKLADKSHCPSYINSSCFTNINITRAICAPRFQQNTRVQSA